MNASHARDNEAALTLVLLDAPSFGPRRVTDLLAKWGDPETTIAKVLGDSKTSRAVREHLERFDPAFYERQIAATRALGGDFKLWNDSSYPANLSKWAAKPPILFYKGDLDGLTTRALALVGRVDPTDAGINAATRFARLCVENNIDVVSGLAKGIDGASHRAALMAPPGNTYAVVGHGLDFAYPAENNDLYSEIPEHGAVVSQFALGVGPQRWTFPARNEAMCTLALGTVIIEGKEGCGSIIQADFSFKHGRPVFILSRNLKSDNSEWARKLVARGAHVIETFEQVTDVVERSTGELWGEKAVQGAFFDVKDLAGVDDLSEIAEPMRAALFDLDGVVVSTMSTERNAVAEVASRSLGRSIDPASVFATGSPFDKLNRLGVRDAWSHTVKSEYQTAWEHHLHDTTVFEDVVSTISRLRDEGWSVGAITSQTRARADKMIPAQVKRLFEVFLTYSDGGSNKASAITSTLKKWSIPSERAFYIGDQIKDVDAAKKAGVYSVAVLWGFSEEADLRGSHPDLVLSTPADSDQLRRVF